MNTKRIKRLKRDIFILSLFLGLGACAGGLAAITDPASPMGMPASALKHSPFTDFFIPGLILFGFFGLGNMFCALAVRICPKLSGYLGFVWGCGMTVWIVVQCLMLWSVAALHVIFFALGAWQAVLGVLLVYEEDLFPFNLIL